MAINIRGEVESDVDAIFDVTEAAFRNHPIGNQTEQFIVSALRDANVLTISLVAEAGGKVVGHVAFSPVSISDGSSGWYGLGPISVLPELQGRGIGKSLVHAGLSSLRELGAKRMPARGGSGLLRTLRLPEFPGPGRRGCPTRERPRSIIRGKRAQR